MAFGNIIGMGVDDVDPTPWPPISPDLPDIRTPTSPTMVCWEIYYWSFMLERRMLTWGMVWNGDYVIKNIEILKTCDCLELYDRPDGESLADWKLPPLPSLEPGEGQSMSGWAVQQTGSYCTEPLEILDEGERPCKCTGFKRYKLPDIDGSGLYGPDRNLAFIHFQASPKIMIAMSESFFTDPCCTL